MHLGKFLVNKHELMRYFCVLLILTYCAAASAQGEMRLKKLHKNWSKLNDQLYILKTELSNSEYDLFISSLDPDSKQKFQVDSTNWRLKGTSNEPYVKYYHRHPAYANYPVVNIDQESARAYCNWLTEKYNSDKKRKFDKVLIRLPSEAEWIQAAKGNDLEAIYPWEGDSLRNDDQQFMCNFRNIPNDGLGIASPNSDNADITAPCKSYWPNDIGCYNISGNVSEWISEDSRSKGGSWLDNAEAMRIDHDGRFAKFSGPSPAIGFRYIVDILSLK